jgi:hypothetical protein
VSACAAAQACSSIVNGLFQNGGLVVALHHVFIDESGTDRHSPVMAMGGYIFRHDQARRFSTNWSRDLKKFGLPYAHMKEATGPSGVYAHLDKEQVIESNKLLIKNIHDHAVIGFTVLGDPALFKKIVPNPLGSTTIYTFMVMSCLRLVNTWAMNRGYKGKAIYFFEAGHESRTEADGVLSSLMKWPFSPYDGHAFMEKSEALPLQAADFLAWHARKYAVDKIQKGKDSYRADFRALLRPQDLGVTLDEIQMLDYREDLMRSAIMRSELVSRRQYLPGLPGYPEPDDKGGWPGFQPLRPEPVPSSATSFLRPAKH